MIALKDITVFYGLIDHPLHPMLRDLISWMSTRVPKITITCAYEKRPCPSVHNTVPLRGIDIRSTIYSCPKDICADINKHWIYDPERPEYKVANYHDAGRGIHIHLQVHDNTQFPGA